MARPDGWESRLKAILREASRRPFDPKGWNCARFAHSCAQAVSGREIEFRWHGSLEASADAVLPRVEPRQARLGDVVLARIPHDALGVCTGSRAAFVGLSGLKEIPMTEVTAAWRV